MIHQPFLQCIDYSVLIFIVIRIMLAEEQLHSLKDIVNTGLEMTFQPPPPNQCCDWHYKLGISDKSHFKIKVIKIMQLWEIFTRFTLKHLDFSFSLFPVRSPLLRVSLRRGKKKKQTNPTQQLRLVWLLIKVLEVVISPSVEIHMLL